MLAVAALTIASVVTIILGNRPEAGVRRDGNGDSAAYRQIVDRMQSGSDF